nr:transglutaminase-like cysteine peptidase [uncultured Sphingomonas sp.]
MESPAKLLLLTALAGAAAVLPTTVGAQVVDGAYRFESKSAAILGAPSALEALRLKQSGASPAASMYRPAIAYPSQPVQRMPVSTAQPDIFGSVALSIAHSPLDARFRAASAAPSGSASAFAAALHGKDAIARIEAVNAYVNARVRFVDDSVQFGVADRWMPVSETLARGRGDCEDFALAKRALLRTAGFADRDLYLVVLKDLTRRADHAVLVVRANGRFLVLDNGTNRIVDSEDVRDYKPIFSFAAGKVWTHGYRRDAVQPSVILASAPANPAIALADAVLVPASGAAAEDEPIAFETASLVPTTISL